jgi:hypothetical protein
LRVPASRRTPDVLWVSEKVSGMQLGLPKYICTYGILSPAMVSSRADARASCRPRWLWKVVVVD